VWPLFVRTPKAQVLPLPNSSINISEHSTLGEYLAAVSNMDDSESLLRRLREDVI
jgi:hypothetical protein